MGLGENPRKIANDVAEGLTTFNSASLRRFEAPDLKIIMDHLNSALADLRMDLIAQDDPQYTEKMQEKNRRMGRVRNAMTVIRAYAHRKDLKGVV